MRLGIIGLPQSGKTTIFNALTRGDKPTALSGGRVEVSTAVVEVPDERVERLVEIFQPKKVVYARVTYADIAGLEGGAGKEGLSGALLNELAPMDGFLLVVRAFEDDSVPHLRGSVDQGRDLAAMQDELLLNDLLAVENKLARLAEERSKGGRDKAEIEREQKLFERLQAALNEEQPLRGLALTPEERKAVGSYNLLTLKPLLVVLNLGEGQAAPQLTGGLPEDQVVAIQGKLEMEIAQLSPDEAQEFLNEYGIEEPSLKRMIRRSYELFELHTFFTYESEEVRAWAVRRGATAPEAAGEIHSDMQRGFIRAEVVSFEDLDRLGSLAAAREGGLLRVEGKDYVVQDGDVVRVRFNV